MMCFVQIGENLNKLSDETKQRYSNILPIKEAYYTRNYITHDYENIDLLIIEDIIEYHIPKLKNDIEALLISDHP